MVVLIWVASAVLIRLIFTSSDTNFNKPLFLTYYSTAFFSLYLIPALVTWLRLYLCKIPYKVKETEGVRRDEEENVPINTNSPS